MRQALRSAVAVGRRGLIEPLDVGANAQADGSRASFLAAAILILTLGFVLVDVRLAAVHPDYVAPMSGYACLAVAYALSRTRWHRIGAVLVIAMFPAVAFLIALTSGRVEALQFLVLSPALAALLSSVRGVAVVTLANALGLALLPYFVPHESRLASNVELLTLNLDAGALAALFLVYRTHSERTRQRELSAQAERLRLALEAAQMGTWDLLLGEPRFGADARSRAILGLESERAPQHAEAYLERVHPEDREQVQREVRRLLTGELASFHMELRLLLPKQEARWCEVSGQVVQQGEDGRPLRVIGTLLDVTRGRELELQLRQAQKMEAVGRLAGGIAHDFNNLLTVILGNAELLARKCPEQAREVRPITAAAQSASTLTRQLLAFSRRSVLRPRAVDLNAAVQSSAEMLRRLIGEDVRVSLALDVALWRVRADPAQVQEVLLNLATNARDAMPHGGSLRIETRNVSRDEPRAGALRSAPAGDFALLAVADDGTGMTDDVRARIFEPFFTTKEVGRGTGLGLSMVFGIITQLGGAVDVDSAPGEGARFRLFFPRAEGDVAPDSHRERRAGGGTERLLIVEDEQSVREVCVRALRAGGYDVRVAESAQQARELLRSEGPPELAILDLVLPGERGTEFARELRRLHPSVSVLFVTGYAPEEVTQELAAPVLKKPFLPAELLAEVRAVLDLRRARQRA
jgi:signal transduction histidine kinase/CheY-like chemotaxis protein